jgi:hypothetical protein
MNRPRSRRSPVTLLLAALALTAAPLALATPP